MTNEELSEKLKEHGLTKEQIQKIRDAGLTDEQKEKLRKWSEERRKQEESN